MKLNYEKHFIKVSEKDTLCLHRFYGDNPGTPVFMVHGAIEDGKIFYSKSGKGFGPFLANNGFDVFIADMRGKGSSTPKVSKHLTYSQTELITNDIPKCLDEIIKLTGKNDFHLVGHSWGGVWLYSFLARTMSGKESKYNIKSQVLFASKRRISVWTPKRLLYADIIWNFYGSLTSNLFGYATFKKAKIGSEDEPKVLFKDMNKWVYTKKWIDKEDKLDYKKELPKLKLPPSLHLTGVKDSVLGNPIDVELLIKEAGEDQEYELYILGKNNGNLHDYGHIDILTHKLAEKDHFITALNWIKKHDMEFVNNTEQNQFELILNEGIATISYQLNNNTLSILSTNVPTSMRGKGIAAEITKRVFEFARKQNYTVTPLCSYTLDFLKKNYEYQDLINNQSHVD